MHRWLKFGLTVAAAALWVTTAAGQSSDAVHTILLRAGPLSTALDALAEQTGLELLYSPDIVSSRRSARVSGALRVDDALRAVLAGSGLSFRHTAGGAILIVPAPADHAPAIPEILVIGRRTQNSDIRRSENDIQPYQVSTRRQILASHTNTVDQFLRTRLPSNAKAQAASHDPISESASNRSEADLHGLGANQTLILIDGARMPSLPSPAFDLSMRQPDLNGLPLFAIERIETLTATAGGIYGPGATGGVVNVVLRRDYRGGDLSITRGVSGRGDAPLSRIDARLGFTPDAGRTDVMIAASHAAAKGLRFGDRGYAVAARRIAIAQNPLLVVRTNTPADALLIQNVLTGPLTFKPAVGGATLGSAFTSLPIGYGGVATDGVATLTARAGQAQSGLAPDGSGVMRSINSDTAATSLLLNVRHHFGENVEAFIDLIGWNNDGRAREGPVYGQIATVLASAPNNPFAQPVLVTLPLPGDETLVRNRLRTARLAAGLVVQLPRAWKADVNVTLGSVRNVIDRASSFLSTDFNLAIMSGTPGPGGKPTPDPFGNWDNFVAALHAYEKIPNDERVVIRDRFYDASLRLAGPLATTKAGEIYLTLLAEGRREKMPVGKRWLGDGPAFLYPSFTQTVGSLYGEVRAPVVARDASLAALRGLELQLAVRYDDNRTSVPKEPGSYVPDILFEAPAHLKARQAAAAYTAGLRAFPQSHVMVRASISTGILPPTPQQLLSESYRIDFPYGLAIDPRRGDRVVGSEAPFTLYEGGSVRLRPERARSLSAGIVINPEGGNRTRLSLDFTHIDKHGEIVRLHPGRPDYFLANEALYPDRVVRAALTPADAALGFTGGVVTQVDTTAFNIGHTIIDALDISVNRDFRVGREAAIRIYGAASWQPRLRRRTDPQRSAIDYVGFVDGPLRWRGNAGVDWEKGPFTIGANGQYYGRYVAIAAADGAPGEADQGALDLPGIRIPAQVYFDVTMAYRFDIPVSGGRARSLELGFNIQNLFDHRPPIVSQSDFGYSFYGDPRRRRFEVSATAHF
ncbi:TonB-dependent receptor [Sphingomonas sp.]|uniref:TonB-dependent receptor n=1 Tax=Sphingomonas sp. TaxID=28214 RepID=UPI003B3B545B